MTKAGELSSIIMIKSIGYTSIIPGPRLLVLGGVHGNEPCGGQGIELLMSDLDTGQLKLNKGSIACIPVANPQALHLQKRYVERDLNRHMYPKKKPKAYEDFIDPILCDQVSQCDIVIDLHSYTSPGGPFCFLGYSSQTELQLARHLGIKNFVYDWAKAYTQSCSQDPNESMGTVEYARSLGKIAMTVECGQHYNSDVVAIAHQVILNALSHLQMIAHSVQTNLDQTFVQMQKVIYKREEGQMTKNWHHLDHLAAGEPIAYYITGEIITADCESVMLMPDQGAAIGSEWFYLGVTTPCPLPP